MNEKLGRNEPGKRIAPNRFILRSFFPQAGPQSRAAQPSRRDACDPQDRRTLDRVAGGKKIARKKQFGGLKGRAEETLREDSGRVELSLNRGDRQDALGG